MGTGKENKVQAAITGALEVYCSARSLQLFPPYANQQGGQKRKYCADLLGVVDGADLIALEIKELNVATGELHASIKISTKSRRSSKSSAYLSLTHTTQSRNCPTMNSRNRKTGIRRRWRW